MKKILLLSDTHSLLDNFILKHTKDVDEIWHAGDIGNIEVADQLEAFKPFRAVFGNIDGADETADKILGRYGIKLKQGCFYVANSNTNLESLLRDTQWSGGAHKQALKRVLGASGSAGMEHFPGSKKSRATVIPLAALIDAD